MGATQGCCTLSAASQSEGGDKPKDVISPAGGKKKLDEDPKVYSEEEMEEEFLKADRDSNGSVDLQEMAALLEELEVKFTSKKLQAFFKGLTGTKDGALRKSAFMSFFVGKDRRQGMASLLQKAIDEKAQKRVVAKPKDVYIFHSMESEAGLRASWWLSNVLEFADLSCSGPYVARPPSEKGSPKAPKAAAAPAATPHKIKDCSIACLLLDSNSAAPPAPLPDLITAEKEKIPVVVFYTAEKDTWNSLQGWRNKCGYAFKQRAVAISMHFLSDSEQLVLKAAFGMLGQEAPFLQNVRPPGGDVGDFSPMGKWDLNWLKVEYAAMATPGMSISDMPPDAYQSPVNLRTVFVSYVQGDPDKKGLSTTQRKRLREAFKRNGLDGKNNDRVIYIDYLSYKGQGHLLDRWEESDLFSLSRFVILDELESSAKDKRPYLERGSNFLEAMICMLTGCLAPCRDNQFVEIDNEIGNELKQGMNLRKYFRENASSPNNLTNSLCGLLRKKSFDGQDQAATAEKILRKALERHPLLVPGPSEKSENSPSSPFSPRSEAASPKASPRSPRSPKRPNERSSERSSLGGASPGERRNSAERSERRKKAK